MTFVPRVVTKADFCRNRFLPECASFSKNQNSKKSIHGARNDPIFFSKVKIKGKKVKKSFLKLSQKSFFSKGVVTKLENPSKTVKSEFLLKIEIHVQSK